MYDPGEWTSLRKAIMAKYYVEAINCPGLVYIMDVNPETVRTLVLNGSEDPKLKYLYSILWSDACTGVFSVPNRIVSQKRSEWKPLQYGVFSLDVGEEAAELRKKEEEAEQRRQIREQKAQVREAVHDFMRGPKESCGTSLADLLKKSGF